MTTKKLKLRPTVKAKWLAALRSGDYEQTSGKLRDQTNGFCCLGVLCNIHAQEHPKFAATQKTAGLYDDHSLGAAKRVLDWAFGKSVKYLTNNLVNIDSPYYDTLAGMNDSGNISFKKIANVIEKQL